MKELVIEVPAKINLFLHYLGTRTDGFAEIITGLQTIDLFDTLIFQEIGSGFEFYCDREDLPRDENNLVYRAASLFRDSFGFPGGVRIVLKKRIPIEAGLGGGSADAAGTLAGLREFFGLNNISNGELQNVASFLGSDVPFFLTRGQAIARGRGEILDEVEFPTNYTVVIIKPEFGISTRWAYDYLKNSLTPSQKEFILSPINLDTFLESLSRLGNDFENFLFVRYPEYIDLAGFLRDCGAQIVRITGSGSAIYGIFKDENEARRAKEKGKQRGLETYLSHPIILKF